MSEVSFIAQPAGGTTLDTIEAISKGGELIKLDIAAAYITSSGTYDLLKRLDAALGADWSSINKRWITSFDYCRTQPIALKTLLSLPASSVRVYDAFFCLAHAGMPRVPFHPKAFLFQGKEKDFALAGSGNLSRSGLSRGVEVGLTITVNRMHPTEPTSAASIKGLRSWYEKVWNDATPLNAALLDSYFKLFDSVANLAHPAATEDDLASGDTSTGALTNKDLQKLRVCSHFWIEAGNITKNRGPRLPGNQLMMKRLSRVFFGFNPIAVPENTPIGSVSIAYNHGSYSLYTLAYSDNKMDKINIPMPGSIGPAAYDNEVLLFSQVSPYLFNLTIGTKANKATWIKNSKAIDAYFKMSSGREWGVF